MSTHPMTPPTPKDVQRYYEPYADVDPSLVKSNNGAFVLFDDYLALAAERDAAVQKARYESEVAAQAMAAKDAAVRELAQEKEGSVEWEEESAAWSRQCLDVQEGCDELRDQLADAERERDDADDALAARQAQSAGTIAQLREKLSSLTAHMNQVHETLGGNDTVLTLEAAQHVIAKLAEAERELDRKSSWVAELADVVSRGRAENAELRDQLADAERERDDAKINETLSNEQRAVLFRENAVLLAKLDAWQRFAWAMEAEAIMGCYAVDIGDEKRVRDVLSAIGGNGGISAALDTARTAATAQGE